MKNATKTTKKMTKGFATKVAANETPTTRTYTVPKGKKMTAREKADLIAANEAARTTALVQEHKQTAKRVAKKTATAMGTESAIATAAIRRKVGAAAHDAMLKAEATAPKNPAEAALIAHRAVTAHDAMLKAETTAPISAATAKANAKATAATKAQLKAAKKAAAPKADQATELAIHINPSGRVCFGKLAAARIGDLGFMKLIDRGTEGFRMIATATETETPIRSANGRPYISASKELKAAGLFDGNAADLIAQPYNSHGFDLMA